MSKRRFEDLKCWQFGREYRKAVHRASRRFPKDEVFGVTAQVRRAACSVTANIAEGYGRYSLSEAAHFCTVARGSLNESLDQLYVALDEGYMDQGTFDALYTQGREVERILSGYISHLRRRASG
jgi:four helix bundle protein